MENAAPKLATPALAQRKLQQRPVSKRELWAWYLYDFGNSAYAAVILLAVYSAYYKQQVVGGAEGSRLWGLSVGVAMLVVAIISPVLGAIADFSASKKRFLFFFTSLACVFTALLFFVEKGDLLIGSVFFILAEIGYRCAQVFYDALLPEIASQEEMGRISGNGWAIGSFGGIVCLLIVLALITTVGGGLVIRLSFLITALFYALSAVPTFIWLRERVEPQPLPAGQNYLQVALKQLGQTFGAIRNFKEFVKFIVAFLIYNDGIMMNLDFAAIIGVVLFQMGQQQLIIFMIIVQITSVVGAYIFGIAADRFGSKRALVVSLLFMIGSVLMLLVVDSVNTFFFIGALAGFALTGVQSVSRTMVGQFAPAGQSAEFYGFFAVAGRTSSFLGPTLYGLLAAEAALWYQRRGLDALSAEQQGLHIAILLILAFLLAGLIVLAFVRPQTPPTPPES